MRTSVTAVLLVAIGVGVASAQSPTTANAPKREWAVSVCDSYLRGLGADDVWSAARSIGVSHVEAVLSPDLTCPYLFEKDGSPYRIDMPAARETLRNKLSKEGITIGCFVIGTKLETAGKDEPILQQIERAAEAAPDVGCRTIMLPIGIVAPKGQSVSDEAFVARGKAFVKKLDAIAAKTHIQIVIENLGHYWNRPEILEPVLRESRPDRVGLLLDATNMYWFGHPLDRIYELARQFAPYVRYVHVKNIRYPEDKRQQQRTPGWEYGKYAEPVRTGDIDFARILGPIAKAGYVGNLTIEDDSLPHFDAAGKKKTLADDAAYLRDRIKELK